MEPVGQQARVTVLDVLTDLSYILFEPVCETTLGTAIAGGPALTVHPASMLWIYPGALLVCGTGENTREVITVTSLTVDGTGFVADFQLAHAASDVLQGPTFPSGQPEKPLFQIAEMLSYISDAQNEFLLRVRPCYSTALELLQPGVPIYDAPDDSIRVEVTSINSKPLWNISRRDLDSMGIDWPAAPGKPQYWFQDEIGTEKLGIAPSPNGGYYADIWYSQRGQEVLTLDQDLLVPAIFAHAVKFGSLSHVFEKDGEMRDPQRAQYCDKRFDLIVLLAQRFMGMMNIPEAKGMPKAKFNPMVVDQ